ncbi:MAG TPA: hypothetical protein PLG50_00790, partial [bacterium]|nr:hypothetical protein [bacterium]
MTSRCLFLTLVLIGAGCRTPEVKPLLNEPVDLGLANSSARMIALQGCGSWKDLLICTIPEMDESASLRFVEKVVRLGYRSLWVRTPPPADSAAAAALLQAGAARLTTPGKKGVMLFGSWPVCGSALSDTVFQAMIWVTAPGPVQEC